MTEPKSTRRSRMSICAAATISIATTTRPCTDTETHKEKEEILIHEETIQKLVSLRLSAMAEAVREVAQKPANDLSLEERLGMIVDREWTHRENRRLTRRLKEARLGTAGACLEDVMCDPARGIDKPTVRALGTCQWVRAKQNVIVVGATGVGKSYLGAALAHSACRQGFRALRTRAVRLCDELAMARGDGSFAALLAKLAKVDVLVLDDFL